MFEIMTLQPEHLISLLKEPLNAALPAWPYAKIAALAKFPYSFSGLVKNDIVICGGLQEYWHGRARLWTVFSENYDKYPVACFRGMRNFLNTQPYHRVEISMPVDFEKAHRRAQLLGFQLECRIAKNFEEDGTDASLYSLVREQ